MPNENLEEGENPRKLAALYLAARGFHVLPVKAGEKRPDPLLAPEGFKNATRDPETIGGWFDAKPRCNVGIACGQAYGAVVLDVDVKHAARGMETLRNLWIDQPTLTANTPSGGLHLYFRHPGVPLPATLDGIDIKGANGGGYVLAPPSTLPNGGYSWRDTEIPIAAFPAHLIDELRTDKPLAKARPAHGPAETLVIPEGRRHQRLLELGAVFRGKGLAPDEIECLLWEHASRYFDPPFSRDNAEHIREIEATVRWFASKEAPVADATVPVITTAELLARADRQPDKNLIEPILPYGGNLMIYGTAGVGKSHLALSVALAVAQGGSFLNWLVEAPAATLFCDGEMSLPALKERILGYLAGKAPPDNLYWLAARAQDSDLPDLATAAGQAHYLAAVESCGAKVAVFDNLSTLRLTTADAPENSAESWMPLASFGRRLNILGCSTIWVHHANKAGSQRGSTHHIGMMDTVIAVRAVNESQADPLAANDVEFFFEKHRRFSNEDAQPVRAKAIEDCDGYVTWERAGADPLAEDVARLRKLGRSIREIAAALNRSKAGVEKALARAKTRGLLPLGDA